MDDPLDRLEHIESARRIVDEVQQRWTDLPADLAYDPIVAETFKLVGRLSDALDLLIKSMGGT